MPRHMAVVGVAAVTLLGLGTFALSAETPQPPPARVRQLAWIAGCWERGSGALVMEEQWMRPRGDAMLGVSRTVRRDTTVQYEHLRIFERNGRVVYAALPSGQALTEFESTIVTDSAVTFENLAHDYPQRIIYRRRGADSLIARIEGTRGGQMRGVDYPFRRAAC